MIFGISNSINTMNNSAFRMMSNNNAMMNLTSFAGNFGNLSTVHQAEKSLLMDNSQSQLMYKISEAQLKALKKLEKENIKRTFSAFA